MPQKPSTREKPARLCWSLASTTQSGVDEQRHRCDLGQQAEVTSVLALPDFTPVQIGEAGLPIRSKRLRDPVDLDTFVISDSLTEISPTAGGQMTE